jgi:hypothetical protein
MDVTSIERSVPGGFLVIENARVFYDSALCQQSGKQWSWRQSSFALLLVLVVVRKEVFCSDLELVIRDTLHSTRTACAAYVSNVAPLCLQSSNNGSPKEPLQATAFA